MWKTVDSVKFGTEIKIWNLPDSKEAQNEDFFFPLGTEGREKIFNVLLRRNNPTPKGQNYLNLVISI